MQQRITRRNGIKLIGLGALALSASLATHAQEKYPSRTITIVMPYPAGGGADAGMRVLAADMATTLGGTIIIDNRPGASGNIGAALAARAKPDGYTFLLAQVSPITINPHTFTSIGFDPLKDLIPVGLIGQNPMVITVHPSVPANNLSELVAYSKAHPGTLNYASTGNGGITHVATELLKMRTGLDATHVPYRGGAPALQGITAGQVQIMNDALVQLMPMVKAGKLKALAVTGAERFEGAPTVPTTAEEGIKDYTFSGWQGLMAPTGTPPEIVRQVKQALDKAMVSAKYTEFLVANVAPKARVYTTEDFQRLIQSDYERWGKVVRAANIKAE